MTTLQADRVGALCVGFAWSQWTALGVRGTNVIEPRCAIDLEALIAFTPALETLEPRLYAEALDWCVQFASGLVSVARLRQVLKLFASDHVERFERFAEIVNREAGARWPARAAKPSRSRFVPSGKSSLPELDSAVLVQLRARKLLGLSARADVCVALAVGSQHTREVTVTATQLAALGFTKRNIADVLADLHAGGLLSARPVSNATHYRLERTRVCVDLLTPLPEDAPRWADRLALAAGLLVVEHSTTQKSAAIRSIAFRKAIDAHAHCLDAIRDPSPGDQRGDVTCAVLNWMHQWLKP